MVILIVLAFAFGVAVVMGMYFGGMQLPGLMLRRKLESRIEEITQTTPEETTGSADQFKAVVKSRAVGPMPALDRRPRARSSSPPWPARWCSASA